MRTVAWAMAIAAPITVLALAAPPAGACPSPPPAVRDIDLPRLYADAEGSKIEPALAQRHKASVEPLRAFLQRIVGDTDRGIERHDTAATRCALDWIAAWAAGDAWLGRMATHQAEYQRKWDLAGVALTYLKLRRNASASQRGVIEPWLLRIADAASAFQTATGRKANNHLYWLGLGLAATAVATESLRHWNEARTIMQQAAGQIGPDGTLPLELARGARALHYHAFAVAPLVMMAEIAAHGGEDWYGFGNGSLHRLVAMTIAGLQDSSHFVALTGLPQERTPRMGAGWLTLYRFRFPDRVPAEVPVTQDRHRWLGGNVRLLRHALADKSRI